jgi:hypothetical protein
LFFDFVKNIIDVEDAEARVLVLHKREANMKLFLTRQTGSSCPGR